MKPAVPTQLVVFDLDGTLVDSLQDIAGAMNETLAAHGYPERKVADFRRFAGDGARVAVQRACERDFSGDPAALDALVDAYLATYLRRGSPRSRPYAGVEELIDALIELRARSGAPSLGVLTNKPHDIAVPLMRSLFPNDPFLAIEGVRPGTPRKPDPAGLLGIIARAGARPESTVYVGDTDTDMTTGLRAGVFTVGCLWGFRDHAELRDSGARAIIAEPLELLDHLTPPGPLGHPA